MVIEPGNNTNPQSSATGKARQETPRVEGQTARGNSPANAAGDADSVSLSDASRAIAKLEASVIEAPDIDRAKVAAVKAAISAGDYQIDAQAIAGKIQRQESQLG